MKITTVRSPPSGTGPHCPQHGTRISMCAHENHLRTRAQTKRTDQNWSEKRLKDYGAFMLCRSPSKRRAALWLCCISSSFLVSRGG
jgi:hypothetical protein